MLCEEIIRNLNYTRSEKGRCEAMSKRITVYTEEGLIGVPTAAKESAPAACGSAMAAGANQCWSMDFVSDRLADGRSFRILTVVDQFTRPHSALADRTPADLAALHRLGKEKASTSLGRALQSLLIESQGSAKFASNEAKKTFTAQTL